ASGNNCTVPGTPTMFFNNFVVSPSAGLSTATVGTNATDTKTVGNTAFLAFQIGGLTWTGPVGFGDILMTYAVTGGIQGVDLMLQATQVTNGGSMTITEVVCNVPFVSTLCPGTTLANISITSSGGVATNNASFAATGLVYIKKDIQFNGATSSELVNSHTSPVPEPMTLSLMGLGLIGLGLIGRRVTKSRHDLS